jgi:pilus assembly protein CpaE
VTVAGAPIRTLLLLGEGVSRESVAPSFAEEAGIRVMEVVETPSTGWRPPPLALVDAVAIACAPDAPDAAIGLVTELRKQRPQLPLVVCDLSGQEEAVYMQRLFAAGADEITVVPEDPAKVAELMRKAMARKQRGGAQAELAPLIAIVGPKGGTGKTVTAVNLAAALAESGQRTALVDLDLSFGDVALGLRLTPERTIHDLARSGESLDAEKLEGFLTTHEQSGARVLMAPIRPDQAAHVRAEFITRVLKMLRQTSDVVIVDTPAGFEPSAIAAIDTATDVVLVGMLDAFALKDAKLGLETLKLMGFDQSKIRIVLNRADSYVGISNDDVATIFGRTPDIMIPSDREIPRSVTEGVPVVLSHKRSASGRAFRQLAALYGHEEANHSQNGKPTGGLRLLRRK